MIDFSRIRKAILEENLSGWLFFNFRHRDQLADLILETDISSINSRGWFYIIFPDRENLKIAHSVEPGALDKLPGETVTYTSREELKKILSRFAGMTMAAQADQDLTQISFLDSGTAALLQSCGISTASSANLVLKTIGTLSGRQTELHERAASALYRIITESWDFLAARFKRGEAVTEKGSSCPERIMNAFCAVTGARDAVTSFIKSRLDKNLEITGFDCDRKARSFLEGKGFPDAIRHRTGHSIDRELHGYGANLDSIEFPDRRKLLQGSCFSVEPGIYLDIFGVRTEINCYINNTLIVSGGIPQREILLIK